MIKRLIPILVSAAIVLGLHILALERSLYWTLSWFDIPMHILGGFVIGLIVLAGLDMLIKETHHVLIVVSTLLGVLVVGLVWELWELFVGFSLVNKDLPDTVLDITMDMVGALLAIGYVRATARRNKKTPSTNVS
jgi:hypothetical protein